MRRNIDVSFNLGLLMVIDTIIYASRNSLLGGTALDNVSTISKGGQAFTRPCPQRVGFSRL